MPGTNIRRVLDTRRLAEALKAPGIDTRHWVSYATVCTVDDEGTVNPNDHRAIYVGPEGVEVDVLLEPLGIPVTCKYAGCAGGREAVIMAPIRPGDRVLVTLPDGDAMQTPVILAVLNSAEHKVPLDIDRKPTFKNDRVMVWSRVLPVEIIAGTIRLGSHTSAEALVLGNAWKSWTESLLTAISLIQVPTAVGPSGTPLNSATFTVTLKNQLASLLSGKAFTEA